MSLIQPFLNQEITSISSTTRDAYGKETLTTVYENVPCRWQEAKLRNVSGEADTLDYRVVVWIQPDFTDVKTNYIITKDGERFKIIFIEKNFNLEGELDHLVLYLA